ncbi:unnamed protein product [Cuscuta campestris]|uniref:Uncharacterized protein n=1 Tax=Cuscuta campestris TaxID=132261 RepID=A0A484LVK9_9ASTE|nr:unnamed protein product [Cuscuta campestris]
MEGSTRKSITALWGSVYNVGSKHGLCTFPCLFKNASTFSDGATDFPDIFERLFVCSFKNGSTTDYQKGIANGNHISMFNLHSNMHYYRFFYFDDIYSPKTNQRLLSFDRQVFQSASLYLSTTTPEQISFALQWFLRPLDKLGLPVAEVILTLLLSLRFINIVFDEVRNIALGIVSRRINWEQLTTFETIDVFVTYIRRIFKNIFAHGEQISQAMIVRGFRGDIKAHKIFLSANSSSPVVNCISLCILAGLIAAVTLPTGLFM